MNTIKWSEIKERYPEMTAWVEQNFGEQLENMSVPTYQQLWNSYGASQNSE